MHLILWKVRIWCVYFYLRQEDRELIFKGGENSELVFKRVRILCSFSNEVGFLRIRFFNGGRNFEFLFFLPETGGLCTC